MKIIWESRCVHGHHHQAPALSSMPKQRPHLGSAHQHAMSWSPAPNLSTLRRRVGLITSSFDCNPNNLATFSLFLFSKTVFLIFQKQDDHGCVSVVCVKETYRKTAKENNKILYFRSFIVNSILHSFISFKKLKI